MAKLTNPTKPVTYKAYDITRAYKRIENQLLREMTENFKKHKVGDPSKIEDWERWQYLQLKELERYRKNNASRFRPEFQDINKQIHDLFLQTGADAQYKEEQKILKAIEDGNFKPDFPTDTSIATQSFFGVNEGRMNALIDATQADFKRAEYAMLRTTNDKYRKVIFDAQVYASAGSYEKAIDMATKDFLRAGIQCVIYRNGSQHTLEEYAGMAIRTGQKRAYLMGEGNVHDKYGIHTVRVNKRQDACPLCMVWVNRVLIDDVYGGGTLQEAVEQKLPTLSQAMSQGFLHPNCRDIYSVYMEGISRPAKPWTKEELEEVATKYNQDQQIKHAEDMQESYQRMADNQLDPDNQARYQARADEWKLRVDELRQEMAIEKES